MPQITYLNGDATQPNAAGPKVIVHICNDIGGWGRGFVMAISERWNAPETYYRQWYADRDKNDFSLGAVQFVAVEDGLWVGNMIGQHGINRGKSGGGSHPIRRSGIMFDEGCRVRGSTQLFRSYAAHWMRSRRRQMGRD